MMTGHLRNVNIFGMKLSEIMFMSFAKHLWQNLSPEELFAVTVMLSATLIILMTL